MLWSVPLLAKLASPPQQLPAAGLYTWALPPTDTSVGPVGFSYGSASVSKKGSVTFSMNLADGISPAIVLVKTLAADSSIPIFASLYGGKGVIMGWVQFETDTNFIPGYKLDLESSNVFWTKLPGPGIAYTNGFDSSISPFTLVGSFYKPSSASTNRLGSDLSKGTVLT